jgi:hypothetical protein
LHLVVEHAELQGVEAADAAQAALVREGLGTQVEGVEQVLHGELVDDVVDHDMAVRGVEVLAQLHQAAHLPDTAEGEGWEGEGWSH